jgi:hypothetical protein
LRAARHIDVAAAASALDDVLAKTGAVGLGAYRVLDGTAEIVESLAHHGIAVRRFPNGKLGIIPRSDQIEPAARAAEAHESARLPAGNPHASGAAFTARSFRARSKRCRDPRVPVHEGRRVPRSRPGDGRAKRTCRCSSATHQALYEELLGIAEGAIVSPEEIVVANHYTDLRDLDPDPANWRLAPTQDADDGASARSRELGGDGCSMFFARTPTGRILAQTWDMHATAIPYVMVLGVPRARTARRRACSP